MSSLGSFKTSSCRVSPIFREHSACNHEKGRCREGRGVGPLAPDAPLMKYTESDVPLGAE